MSILITQAEKARLDTSFLLRSQVLPPRPPTRPAREHELSSPSGPSMSRNTSAAFHPEPDSTDKPSSAGPAEVIGLKARVKNLEEEVKALKVENERHVRH